MDNSFDSLQEYLNLERVLSWPGNLWRVYSVLCVRRPPDCGRGPSVQVMALLAPGAKVSYLDVQGEHMDRIERQARALLVQGPCL